MAMRAAVLAAGRGVRMGGRKPKTLLPLDEREPLLHFILDGLKRAGIADVLMVTGFQPTAVQEFVAARTEGLEVAYVFNARYASWGNFHSLRLALDQSPGRDLLVVNSDVVINPEVLMRVTGSPGDLVLAVQRRQNLDPEDMRVELQDDRVRQIGKGIKMVRSHGEFAGISLLRRDAARLYQEIASDREWVAQTTGYYEDVYAQMLTRVDVRAAPVEADEYAEVDRPEDVTAAVAVVDRYWDGTAEDRPAPDAAGRRAE